MAVDEARSITVIQINFEDKNIHKMLEVMEKREAETGLLLCPCSFVPSVDLDNHDRLVRCPCGSLKADLDEKGKCHCGIFSKGGN
jgi:ferredoxin-thioredoxin reductase catalytic subunit